jgi:HEAT repeat protein
MSTPEDIPFHKVTEALQDADTSLDPRYLYRFSDLEAEEINALEVIWPDIPLRRKQSLMEDVEDLSARDTLLSFVSFACLAVKDEDPKVRLVAVRTLWDYEDSELIPIFLDLLQRDNDPAVRAAAAGALGRFVYAGELEKIPRRRLSTIVETLLTVVNGEDYDPVRRSALESLGYSSREEVPHMIQTAFASTDKDWVASALFAMGRSANPRWNPQVMDKLDNTMPSVRCEAARAAGELEIADAVPQLMELLDDPDENTRFASIWSLSQIGGEGVRNVLEELYEDAEDQADLYILESALDNLAFNEGVQFWPLFDFPEDNEDNADNIIEPFEDNEDMAY